MGEQPNSKHWASTTAARRRRRAAALGVLVAVGIVALLGRALWPAGRPPAAPGPAAVVADSGGMCVQ